MKNQNPIIDHLKADNDARTEVIRQEDGSLLIYSGNPQIKDPAGADNGPWSICRTIVTQDAETGSATIENTWTVGPWNKRALLNYNYI